MPSLETLYKNFTQRETEAKAANLKREQEVRQTYSNLIAQSETGGAAKVAGLADIERGKTQAIGAGTQQMISSGLYGTTTAASVPVQAENQASYQRLKLEDILQQRTQGLKLGQAEFVERIQNPYPDYSALIQAMIAQASQPKTPQITYSAGGRMLGGDVISGGSGYAPGSGPGQAAGISPTLPFPSLAERRARGSGE